MRWFLLPLIPLISLSVAPLSTLDAAPSQQPSPAPLAPGPLLNRAPNFSQWLISVTSGTNGGGQIPDQTTKFDTRMLVTKTGDIRREITVGADGRRTEKWCEGALQATAVQGQAQPIVSMHCSDTPNNPNFTDYSQSDFPGFGWISKDNYIGVETVEGIPCIVFHTGPTKDAVAANPNAAADPLAGNTAYIAADARLPVLLISGGVSTLFQFEQPPTAPLAPPPNFLSAFSEVQTRINQAEAAPPR